MRLLHKPFKANRGQKIEVTFDHPTNVKFMTAENFKKYKKGKTHSFYGGWEENSPVIFKVPKAGVWHAIIEKGSFSNPMQIGGNAFIHPQLNTIAKFEIEKDPADEIGDDEQPAAKLRVERNEAELVREEALEDNK